MAFVQFTVSPGLPKPKISIQEPEETPKVCFAPFTPNVKLCFENVIVGTLSVQQLLLVNPTSRNLTVEVKNIPPLGQCVKLSWTHSVIPPQGEIPLEISWFPITETSWRHNFTFEDNRHMKKDVSVTFRSIIKKSKVTKSKQPKYTASSKKVKKSPKRISPKHRLQKNISPSLRGNMGQHQYEQQFAFRDKENINPKMKSQSYVHINLHGTEVFHTPNNTSFNIEPGHPDFGRETYTVMIAKNSFSMRHHSPDMSNDSLETQTTFSKSSRSSINSQSTPRFIQGIESATFTPLRGLDLSGVTPIQASGCTSKQLFLSPIMSSYGSYRSCNSSEKNTDENNGGNISTETYVKGDISTETYTVKNTSSSTYVKDNSIGNCAELDIADCEENTTRTVLFGDTQKLYSAKDSSILHQAHLSGENTRTIIEANLWAEGRKLDSIKEETFLKPLKRKSTSLLDASPPKRMLLQTPKRVPEHNPHLGWNKKPAPLRQTCRLSFELRNPFSTAHLYQNEEWVEQQEVRFKKWLNALLTPPAELVSNTEGHPVDVAKLWQQCKNKPVAAAVSKDVISNEYHTNNRLDLLRKAARKLFRSTEVSEVLGKALKTVDCGKLVIRKDRDIHLDLGLQAEVMSLFLSYNPLWLRIGLETIYNTTLNLSSNSDIMGLSTFIMQRFFKDQFLLKKHKSLHSPKYEEDIKKFILKKFLVLVYFLDIAKLKTLIAHDPCLFCKNAPVKESREILLHFSRDLVAAIGDVTKFLRFTGYSLNHVQKYIHEFDYNVIHLGVDLRDGVRLTKVMEIILMRTNLTNLLRVPAISRLQKIHNMKTAFDALIEARFEIAGDITPKDIVDGHHEKTLSLLWQIIYKFHAPFMVNAATTIQKWWRSLIVVIKRRILFKRFKTRDNAARNIQLWYRRRKMMQKLHMLQLAFRHYQMRQLQERSATKIQSYIKMYLQRREYLQNRRNIIGLQSYIRRFLVKNHVERKIHATVIIQSYIRMWIKKRQYVELQTAVTHVQRRYKANRLMQIQQENYTELKITTIFIQRRFRANQDMKKVRRQYLQVKAAVITLQKHFRAKRAMKIEREKFLQLKHVVLIIENYYLASRQMKKEENVFLELKKATCLVQRRFRANQMMKTQYSEYQRLKTSAIIIQERFRATIVMRKDRAKFQETKKCVICIQNHFRATKAMRIERQKFLELKTAVLFTQQKLRANWAMNNQCYTFQQLKKAAIFVQSRYRAIAAMRYERENFTKLKQATLILQQRFRANQAMKSERLKYQKLKQATIFVQRKLRANWIMKKEHHRYEQLKKAAVFVQNRYRAIAAMRYERENFTKLKQATLILQQRFRANQAMKSERLTYQKLKQATIFVQRKLRANWTMKKEHHRYEQLKKAAIFVQSRYRAIAAMRYERENFTKLKQATLILQQRFRANQAMKSERLKYQKLKQATIFVQRKLRANWTMKKEHHRYEQLKKAAVFVQNRYRAIVAMRYERENFMKLKQATLILQQRFRANQAMKSERLTYQKLKQATLFVQRKLRANWTMKKEHHRYEQLKKAAVFVQNRYRAIAAMRYERENFMKLNQATLILQQRFRANQAMKSERLKYQKLKQATIFVQRKLRANWTMKKEHHRYEQLKKAAIFVQSRYRAIAAMRYERENFTKLKQATLILQQRFRANQAMKSERLKYQKLKQATIFVQRKLRANWTMKKEHHRYEQLKKAAVFVQNRYRAIVAMRYERENFMKLKQATLILQQRFRANQAMKSERLTYQKLKQATLFVQRKLRANWTMKKEHHRYEQLKKAAVFVQNRYRAIAAMRYERENFMKLNQATLILQQRFRANQAMKSERLKYQKLKQATIFVQRKLRANWTLKKEHHRYEQLKKAAVFVQNRYRAIVAMRYERENFMKLKQATLILQQRFRANQAMKSERLKYQKLKQATIFVQRKLRANWTMKKEHHRYEQLKKAAVFVQNRYRAIVAMRYERENFMKLKQATLILQQRFRANQAMKSERLTYQKLKQATLFVQRKLRANWTTKKEHNRYEQIKKAAIIIQRRFRANKIFAAERNRFVQLKSTAIVLQRLYRKKMVLAEDRNRFLHYLNRRKEAAVKIQAWWRSYLTRKRYPELANIRKNLEEVTSRADISHTLGQRRVRVFRTLMTENNLCLRQIIKLLEELDILTRRCGVSCIQLSERFPEFLYATMNFTNRSLVDMQASALAVSILINICKYPPSSKAAWLPKHMENVLTMMVHCCDKEDRLFPYLCTLVWLFAHVEEYKIVLMNIPEFSKKMYRMKILCNRKQKMVLRTQYQITSYFDSWKANSHVLPSLFPDWGFDYPDRPRTFTNSIHALRALLKILNISEFM